MSTAITTCEKCGSDKIKEITPENRKLCKKPLCKIECLCKDCGHLFVINSWTEFGKHCGIMY